MSMFEPTRGHMFEPTRAQILDAIEPLTEAAKSPDPVSVKASIVLAALAGCLVEPMSGDDVIALDALAKTAAVICQHQAGLHR